VGKLDSYWHETQKGDKLQLVIQYGDGCHVPFYARHVKVIEKPKVCFVKTEKQGVTVYYHEGWNFKTRVKKIQRVRRFKRGKKR